MFAPVGTANAYDAMHLLGAGDRAGRIDRRRRDPRGARGSQRQYQGLIKTYSKPFSAENHDALGAGRLHHGAIQGRADRAGDAVELAAAAPPRSPLADRAGIPRAGHAALITGLGLGSMYGLLALGFHVTYAVSNTVNFAQGSTMMLGAVLCFTLWVTLGWPLPLAVALALAACAAWGVVRRARGGAAVRPARLQLLADGDRRARHRAGERGAVHLRQGSARHAVRLPHHELGDGRRHQDPAAADR